MLPIYIQKKNILVIDAGTCITYDFIDKTKKYLGGSISPGISMRLKALNNFTDKLPLVERKDWNGLIGKSTEEAILAGVYNGILHEMDGIIDEYNKEYKQLITIITGGDSNFFGSKLKNEIFAVSNLIHIGLNENIKATWLST